MIDEKQIAEILSLYKKHGWTLSRVLLSAGFEKELPDKAKKLFGAAQVERSEINAAWFSRPSKYNREAWELRHLAVAPFALFEVFEPETENNLREQKLREMEAQMTEKFKK